MKKRLLAILLVLCMVLSLVPAAVAADSVFTDVKADDWFADEVAYVYENGLMQGVGNSRFDPNGTTTRAMIVTILWRLEGEPIVNYAMDFEDAEADSWYTEAIRWAASNKIVEGYGGGKFGTSDDITREQMVTILYRYAQYKGHDAAAGENTNILSYGDASEVAEWAIPAMQWACGTGLIQGISDDSTVNLQPRGSATRAQAAAIFCRFIEKFVHMENNEPTVPGTHSVTFMWNYSRWGSGDKGAYAAIEIADGQSVGELSDPYRSGYKFVGWYTEDGTLFDLNTRVTEDIVVYAKWSMPIPAFLSDLLFPPEHIHVYGEWEPNGDCTHSKKCSCGAAVTENCDEYSICSVCGFDRLAYVLKYGGTVTLRGNSSSNEYAASANAEIKLDGNKLSGSVSNVGNLTVNGFGTMESAAAALVDRGSAALRNVTVKAGSPTDYAVISRGGKTSLENVSIESAGGGVGAADGAKVVFNGGSVAVNSASTSGRYNFYAEGQGTEIRIKSGTFSFSSTLNQKRAYIYAGEGTTVYVEGGNFGPASTRDGYTAGIMGSGSVIITGGTFGFDPTKWVAPGYFALKDGNVWTVTNCLGHTYDAAHAEKGYHKCLSCSFAEMCTPSVVNGGAVTCAVCGADYIVAAEASFALDNITVQDSGAGVESYGSLTMKEVVVNAGSPTDYAVIIKGGTANLEDVAVTSAGGGVGVVGGSQAIFDGGSVAVNTTSTSGRYNFYVVDEGTRLTIKGGDFSFSKTLNQKRAYIYAGAGATVYVEGGNFGPASTRSGYTDGILGSGTVIITGGTFGFDPTKWVAPGYAAVKSGSVWTVSPVMMKAPLLRSTANSLASAQIVNDPSVPDVARIGETGYDTLAAAIQAAVNGDVITLIADISVDEDDVEILDSQYNTFFKIEGKNITIDLNGKTVYGNAENITQMGGVGLVGIFSTENNGHLTLEDSVGNAVVKVETGNGVAAYSLIVNFEDGCTITINGGNYSLDRASDNLLYTAPSAGLIVNGGTFILGNVGANGAAKNYSPWIFNAYKSNQRHALVNGGSYNFDISKQYWDKEVKIADGMIVQYRDGLYHVISRNVSITRSGEPIYFDTMTEAIAAAQDGDTIILEQNITVDVLAEAKDLGIDKLNSDIPTDQHVTLFCVEGKRLTIDLNGKQIKADVTGLPAGVSLAGLFSTRNGGHLTLMDSVDTGVAQVNAVNDQNPAVYANVFAMIINLDDTSSIVINSGTYILDRAVSAMIDTRSNEGVIVNGGTFELGNVFDPGLKNGQAWTFNAKGQNTRHVIVTGGTFPADIQHQYYPFEVSIAKELALKYDENTEMYTVVPAVAYVNEQEFSGRWYTNEVGYATLEEAYDAVEPPKTSWDGKVSAQEYVTSLLADYYGSLSDAFGGSNVLPNSTGASVSVAEEDGKKVVTLLSDVTLADTLNIVENATLNLNGHKITSASEVAIRTQANVAIDGTKEGSAVTVNAPAGQKGTVLSAMAGELTVNGGTYTSNTSSVGTKNSPTQVIYTNTGTTLNVNDATVVATNGGTGFAAGIRALGDAVIKNSAIIAEGNYKANAAGTDYGSSSNGISSAGELKLYDCYVWGAHSGVRATGSVYVDGGTYEGYGHGGFYLAGGGTTSYFYNATTSWAPMRDGFMDDGRAGTNGAGMYIGGGSSASNITAYFDGCTFNTVDANGFTYDGWTPPRYGIVLRTSSGESNNKVYISNSRVERAGDVMFRGVGTKGHTVYNGVGNDWSKANSVHSANSTYYINTTESYGK